MLCRINDFKYKDVVNAGDGVRLGYVGDVELDTCLLYTSPSPRDA